MIRNYKRREDVMADKKPKSNKNEPKYLPHILKTIAHYKNDYDVEKLAKEVTKTTKDFFKI